MGNNDGLSVDILDDERGLSGLTSENFNQAIDHVAATKHCQPHTNVQAYIPVFDTY